MVAVILVPIAISGASPNNSVYIGTRINPPPRPTSAEKIPTNTEPIPARMRSPDSSIIIVLALKHCDHRHGQKKHPISKPEEKDKIHPAIYNVKASDPR